MTVETHHAKVSAGRRRDSEAVEARTPGFLYRLPRNRDFIYSLFPSKLESQVSALGFDYANQVLLGVDYSIVSFEDYVPDFDGLVVKKALGGDAVDPKPAANTEGEGAVAYVDETGHDQR